MHVIWSTSLDKADIQNRRAKMRVQRLWRHLLFGIFTIGIGVGIYIVWTKFTSIQKIHLILFDQGVLSFILWFGIGAGLFLVKEFLSELTDSFTLAEVMARSKDTIAIDKYFSKESLWAIDTTHLRLQRNKNDIAWLPFCLLEAMLQTEQGAVIVTRLGRDPEAMRKKLNQLITQQDAVDAPKTQEGYFKNVLYTAFEHALKTNKHYVNIDDMFWALSIVPSDARDFLVDHGIDESGLEGMSQWLHISREISRKNRLYNNSRLDRDKHWRNQLWTSTVTPLLDSVGRDITAEVNSFYPLVGREEELNKIYELVETGALGLLLLGPKGSGITKLIEGLAQKIVSQQVPPSLADRRVHSLSLGKLLSLSGPQASIKALAQQLTQEIQRSENIILVLEDLPSLEAVKTEEAAIILEQLLMDALNNKKLILLATATPKTYIQTTGSLLNALQKVSIKPLNDADTLKILETMAPFLEQEYRVHLTYQALKRTVELSKYLHDLAQPAQAVQTIRRICESQAMVQKQSWVTGSIVEQQIAAMTQLPLAQVSEQESSVLINLEELIYQKYVNQSAAVTAVAAALRRARTQLKDHNRPIGSFLFLGPTGVGKTELARRLAEIYFKSSERMIRLDMSEYQEVQSLRNLIGAPPGTGSDEEGSLIKAVKENPFSVILLDELEKAHPDILNIFLQVMEDGRLTSSTGETYDFSHTIIIGTSNAGAVFIQKSLEAGLSMKDIEEGLKKRELLEYYKPEFLNRFDATVVFKPLDFSHVLIIARILLKALEDQLAEQGFVFEATPDAVQDLAREGFNPTQGARPLRRVIQDRIEDQIAKHILYKQIKQRDKIVLKKDFVIEVQQARHY